MKIPTLSEIDQIRKKGFRPQAVGCFVNSEEKKVFMFFDENYKLWQFPQGGIENKEAALGALGREMSEELGAGFITKANLQKSQFIGQESITFAADKRNLRELLDDEGNALEMKGKWYHFFAISTKAKSFDKYLESSEFHAWKLLTCVEAEKTAETIYQKGKQRITLYALNLLSKNGLIE